MSRLVEATRVGWYREESTAFTEPHGNKSAHDKLCVSRVCHVFVTCASVIKFRRNQKVYMHFLLLLLQDYIYPGSSLKDHSGETFNVVADERGASRFSWTNFVERYNIIEKTPKEI